MNCLVSLAPLCVSDANDKTYSNNKKLQIKIMVVDIVQNFIHMYYSYYKIIKSVDFKSIYYAINLNIVLSFRVFNYFDYIFLPNNVLLV